jgi:multidrug efflux pump subunit AcrA (membrane-fusion protein)
MPKFSVQVGLADEDDAPEWLMPGMTCKASIVTYEAEDAVVIPADLLQTDADDKDKKYVMILEEEGDKPERRDLKLGKTKDKEVEVLRGLANGDRIVKGAKDESKDDASEKDGDE